MSHLISPKDAIAAYQVIREKGTQQNAAYEYGGITAETDWDGYTVFLKDNHVSMTVYYHYKYQLDYENIEQLDAFRLKIKAILD